MGSILSAIDDDYETLERAQMALDVQHLRVELYSPMAEAIVKLWREKSRAEREAAERVKAEFGPRIERLKMGYTNP